MKRLCVVLLVLLVAAAQAGVEITTAVGNGADTFVGNDSNKPPTGNYGSRGTMDIRDYPGVRAHIGYVRFDIGGVTDGDLTGAQLQLFLTSAQNSRDWDIYGLMDNDVDDAWDEMAVTYNTIPGMLPTDPEANGNYIIDATKLTLLGTMYVPAGSNYVAASDTASLNLDAFLAGDTNGLVTFVLIGPNDQSGKQYYAATKEGAEADSTQTQSAPTLILPNAVPEPATLFLLGLGGLAALRRKS